jgi:hypothetical protein
MMAWGQSGWMRPGPAVGKDKQTRKKKKRGRPWAQTGYGGAMTRATTKAPKGKTLNTAVGNPRFNRAFKTEKAKGGEWHVYGKNDRVFVPGPSAKKKDIGPVNARRVEQLERAQNRAPKKGIRKGAVRDADMVAALIEQARGVSGNARRRLPTMPGRQPTPLPRIVPGGGRVPKRRRTKRGGR